MKDVFKDLMFQVFHSGISPDPPATMIAEDMKRKSSFSLLDQTTKRPMPGEVPSGFFFKNDRGCYAFSKAND